SRAVLIMYFWSALIAFGAVGYSVHSTSLWIVLVIMGMSALGLVLLLLPRFTPRAPYWAERFVPPRYRRIRGRGEAAEGADPSSGAGLQQGPAEAPMGRKGPESQERTPVVVGVSGVNGATAIGPRSRFSDRDKAESAR
ncbi:undecaprenyl/decaprenyl-phosphate alpha-N-acetylglucosaminyl 1-phosphate transferase, partial [Streptomyces mirabilis]